MRRSLFPLFVVCLLCAFSVSAQRINEAGSKIILGAESAEILFAVDENSRDFDGSVSIEVLDIRGEVISAQSQWVSLKQGRREVVRFRMTLEQLFGSGGSNAAFYRLRYRIGETGGIIAFSSLINDLFELRVVSTGNIFAGMNYRSRVVAVNPFTGLPLGGVRINAKLSLDLKGEAEKQFQASASGETDADGTALFDFVIPPAVELESDGSLDITGEKNGLVRGVVSRMDASTADSQFLMMIDKPIFQPEQAVNVRGVLLKGREMVTASAGKEIQFRIEDEDDTVLYREKVPTSEFGVASFSWTIPANARLGDYTIYAELDDDRIGYETVKVSRYDLPNFIVTAKPNKLYYLPKEKTAEVEVRADYLFGRPVTRGRVRVVRETSRKWNWKEQRYDIDEGEAHEGETDSKGVFRAKFNLAEDHSDLNDDEDDYSGDKFEDLRMAAYFTDSTTNRTEQRRFDVRITREPIHVYLVGETYGVNPLLPMEAYITAFYADGTPAAVDVEIKASEEGEDKFRTIGRVRTNALGIAKAMLKRPKFEDDVADMDLRLIARDAAGRTGKTDTDVDFDFGNDALHLETERAIYKPGEPIGIKVLSTKKTGRVFVDIVRGWSVIDSRFVDLVDGQGRVTVPYDPKFRGVLTVAVFIDEEDDDGEVIRTSRGIIYPRQEGLQVKAEAENAIYKPGENAHLGFSVFEPGGGPVESALGVVIRDRAVDERARTDSAFGGGFRDYAGWLGYGKSLGAVNIKDINDLDLTKPIPPEMDVIAGALLYDSYYYPQISRSLNYNSEAAIIFAPYFRKQFEPLGQALENYYTKNKFLHPVDNASLKQILLESRIAFDSMADPWGMKYRAEFSVDRDRDTVRIFTNGPDKKPETDDDFTVSTKSFPYFTPMGLAIDRAIWTYRQAAGEIIRDEKTLFNKIGVSGLIDRFGRPYLVKFSVDRRMFIIRIISTGPDGKAAKNENAEDDFTVWTNRTDYFALTEEAISTAIQKAAAKPRTRAQFTELLNDAGIKLDSLRDGYGSRIYLTLRDYSRYSDRVVMENQRRYGDTTSTLRTTVVPITQQVVAFSLRSPGFDGKKGTRDDFTLAEFQVVVAEQTKDEVKPVTKQISYTGSTGAVTGVVRDPNGAIIPGANVTATNEATKQERKATTDSEGRYMIINLPPGKYSVTVDSPGFLRSVAVNIPVIAGSTTDVDIVLNVGAAAASVNVVSAEPASIETSSSIVSTNVTVSGILALPLHIRNPLKLLKLAPGISKGDEPNSTPRLREYFPETLFWNPELITGSDGKAGLDFKLADNITTWKMYAVATTKDGRVGLTEKDITVFQSFFVDLDPPKFLTEGDEISLPTQVRNFTATERRVDISMDKGDWFSFLGNDRSSIDVPSGETANAIFGFKALRPIKAGKQRVTALAGDESDAIEKPVTVLPNGQEVPGTDSRLFTESDRIDVDFPDEMLPGTQHAEVKIYPNLWAHVSEAVEGLLKRPYGCGEQTVSSTYPNLMILRFARAEAPIRRPALNNLRKGYERMIGYQMPDGGFSYWGGRDASDLALTAYTIRFLNDAADFVEVDSRLIERAMEWLTAQQRPDGSWYTKYSWEKSEDTQRAKILTTYISRTLAMVAARTRSDAVAAQNAPASGRTALLKALDYLRERNEEIDEPYSIALFGLASLDSGRLDDANSAADRLAKMEIAEGSGSYWKLESNTPFNGWGSAGRIETTALVTQLFARLSAGYSAKGEQLRKRTDLDNLVSRGLLFLLKNKDRYGVWYSTQTTINVLDAFLSTIGTYGAGENESTENFSVAVNGAAPIVLKAAPDQIEPLIIDISDKLGTRKNNVEITGPPRRPIMAQVVTNHYIDWAAADASGRNVNRSRALRLDYSCNKTSIAIMDEVSCSVEAERIGFQGYGMLLAEIGIPPGADVSRESLEAARESDWSFSRYDVLPDRIVVYLWAKAGGTKINFKFRPRYAINAQAPSSLLYDYYNPEARAAAKPLKFTVK